MADSILIADDDEGVLSALKLLLKSERFRVVAVDSPRKTMEALRNQDYSLVLIDLNYSLDTTSGEEGLELISSIRELDDIVPIVVMTGWGTIDVAVNTMKTGANDFIQKPWENDRLLAIVENQIKLANIQRESRKLVQQNRLLQDEISPASDIVAESGAVKRVIDTINRAAPTDANILLTGENGTGKSMFARYIHNLSSRKNGPMISVNMGAVTESLFESEMFGHVKGAFTDAASTRIGRFELADKGTLFLDEVANMPLSQQGKLLRVLEDQEFEKVGSSKTQAVDVRLICATNSDLDCEVREGGFRRDFLYRINTIEIEVPPLRQRVDDIIPLARTFLSKAARKYSRPAVPIEREAEAALKEYSWPGNIRELSNVMERARILSGGRGIRTADLGLQIPDSARTVDPDTPGGVADLRPLDEVEADIISERLAHFNDDAQKAATSLGLSRSAFYRRLAKFKRRPVSR